MKGRIQKYLKNNWEILLILIPSLLTVIPLMKTGYFSHHDDLQIIRIFEMRKCLADLQIPCRWVPDMGYGFGYPMFNYYGVFPYYLGSIINFIFGYIATAKILFLLPLILGGIFVFLLSREIFDRRIALIAGVLYTFAPYRAVDAYVRGAITELFAITLLPLVLYFILKLTKKYTLSNFIASTLSLSLFLLNHNIINMFFLPILLMWLILNFYLYGWKNFKIVSCSLILGFGLASFYLIPAFFEKNLVQIENLLESELIPNFRAHFVTLRQLFISREWGWGPSTWLEEDKMSFQIGIPQWPLALISGLYFSILFIKNYLISRTKDKKSKSRIYTSVFFLILFLVATFMTHNRSAFIWEKISYLQYAQFPWRFLGISILAVSVLGGTVFSLFKNKQYITVIVVISVIALNSGYFKPNVYFSQRKDDDYLSGEIWDYQRRGAIVDYLPKEAEVPNEPAPLKPEIIDGKVKIERFEVKSNRWRLVVDVEENANLEIPVFYFPNWIIYIDGIKTDFDLREGKFIVNIPLGRHFVDAQFKNTFIRSFSNTISTLSLIGFFVFIIYGKSKKIFR